MTFCSEPRHHQRDIAHYYEILTPAATSCRGPGFVPAGVNA
jgi:hypothetical protein